jgi:hypothetical protein
MSVGVSAGCVCAMDEGGRTDQVMLPSPFSFDQLMVGEVGGQYSDAAR